MLKNKRNTERERTGRKERGREGRWGRGKKVRKKEGEGGGEWGGGCSDQQMQDLRASPEQESKAEKRHFPTENPNTPTKRIGNGC